MITSLAVHRSELLNIRRITQPSTLAEGEVLMKIDTFSYTSNNTTYAVVADMVGYWKFFPTEDQELGIIPCWGYATVTATKHGEIAVGQRFYGYYPMGTHLIASPTDISPRGFTDGAAHRHDLPSIYNQYLDTAHDPTYQADLESVTSLFRPLFTTSFLLHVMLEEEAYFGATQMILTSASSKTAMGLAHCLQASRIEKGVKVTGLTSGKNKEFVSSSGLYDTVIGYEERASVEVKPSVIVDFSGNHNLQADLQEYLGAELKFNSLVGVVHHEDRRGERPLRERGTLFFAPTYFHSAIEQMGAKAFGVALGDQFQSFITSLKKLKIVEHHGFDELEKIHKSMTKGDINPSQGHIVKL